MSWGPDRIDIFVGGGSNALHQKVFNSSGWSGWYNLGGSLTSDPTVSSQGADQLDIYARNASNGLSSLHYGGGYCGLEQLAGPRLAVLGQRLRTGLELLRDRQQGGLLPRHRQRPLAASVLTPTPE